MAHLTLPLTRHKHAKNVRRCIRAASDESGMSEFAVAVAMSRFLEEVMAIVSENDVVHVPGFGVFGPMAWVPRVDTVERFCYPGFSANSSFRRLVRAQCNPADGAALTDLIRKHRGDNYGGRLLDQRYVGSHVWKAHRSFRESIRKQAKKIGMTV